MTTAPSETTQHETFLRETLALARESLKQGSSPIGALLVDKNGQIVARGRNRTGEPQTAERVGDASVAHAEMDVFFQAGKLENPQELTLYSSLEPCLMCGGASALLEVGRIVWATADPWGGAGRLLAWSNHPAMQEIEIVPCPFPELETEGASLFAPEAKKAFPDKGWALWRKKYPAETEGI
ncbi:nucleoside deaminase [Deinococcus arenicola]|uniref:Nucleoside deaminase n=1 Tax=Deinococcus arenicola TaxID=2994950 RepID=A0ABU4DNG0_9DEIO|nr:nucleoside deaminase [Deinococcus sp. ZS9-10]MDV6373967.1 nucleoside deaminase [Deinococcus sp. ZS9-10]